MDAIIISDTHLSAYNCQRDNLLCFLEKIKTDLPERLIIAGDLFDSFQSRLNKVEWKILGILRSLANDLELVWVKGNHDCWAEAITMSHLLGATFYSDYYTFASLDSKIVVFHGDSFDNFLTDHPFLTAVGDWLYWLMQKLDASSGLAKFLKHQSKNYLHCSYLVQERARKSAASLGCQIAVCGHTHLAVASPDYYNSGCWTELPCSYLMVDKGMVKLEYFQKNL